MRHRTSAALLLALIAGCTGDDTVAPSSINLSLDLTNAALNTGSQGVVTATLVRGGGYAGVVTFTVTGAPAGVTATVDNAVTTGGTTAARITLAAAIATVPGIYSITVHATGAGVPEATATLALTIALGPGYELSLDPATLTRVQGAAGPPTTVRIDRTNFTGGISLTIDVVPVGVTAVFDPPSPVTGNSTLLALSVAGTAAPGTYNLVVRGKTSVLSGLADRTVTLTLIVLAASASR